MGKNNEVLTTDVCVVGAGPHGLAATLLFKRIDPSMKVTVIDRSDEWLSSWNRQFQRADISTLRSPIVHHPSPDSFALDDFLTQSSFSRSGLPYNPPTTECFSAFCAQIINDANLDDPLIAAPQSLQIIHNGIELKTTSGIIRTRYLIIATNPNHKIIPQWTKDLSQRPTLVKHASDVDLYDTSNLEGQSITVIGGGLTAAHLSRGAALKGASVKMVARRPLQIRNFDTDPGWLGPKYLNSYYLQTDSQKRIQIAREARGGGSIPQYMHDALLDFEKTDSIKVLESTQVTSAETTDPKGCLLKLTNDETIYSDQVWLATGTCPDLQTMGFLHPILENVSFVDEYPVLDRSLRLKPHPIYLMGRTTTYALGPAAGNLWGATRAAHRITTDITGVEFISNGT